MASSSPEILHDYSPLLRVYKDGRLQRLLGTDVVPASVDPTTGVQSKDVVIAPQTGVSARLYLPKNANPNHKLPLLVYFHGGGFVVESAFSPTYHNYLNLVVAEANVVAVSVDYRLAPEHPLPVAYDDCWDAVKWVASHSTGGVRDQEEPWLKEHVDFERVFIAGDSSGANITHHMGMRVGLEKLEGCVKLVGIILGHPYFWGTKPVGSEVVDVNVRAFVENLWRFACPSTTGADDPLMNPAMDPKLSRLGCSKVLVFVAEADMLRDRGWYYHEVLGKSGWGGKSEVMEAKGEGHVFYLQNSTCENAVSMLKRVVSFLNQDKA